MRKAIRAAATTAVGVSLAFGLSAAVSPATAGADPSCSVPSGYTYDSLVIAPCTINGQVVSDTHYNIVLPASGIWVCQIPAGYRRVQVMHDDSCSGNFTQGPIYLIQKI